MGLFSLIGPRRSKELTKITQMFKTEGKEKTRQYVLSLPEYKIAQLAIEIMEVTLDAIMQSEILSMLKEFQEDVKILGFSRN